MAPSPTEPFDPAYGEAVPVAPSVVRVTASNRGPFTGPGTNSYIVGTRTLAVVDPGPDDPAHLDALVRAIDGRPVSHILVTHTHADHSPLASRLAAMTGAQTVAEGPHRAARVMHAGEENHLDASADRDFAPDMHVDHDASIEGEEWRFEAVLTPGHTANHCAFAMRRADGAEPVLFVGDHVMEWATTIVAPPDGSMADYLASLDLLLARQEAGLDRAYLPGHGAALASPRARVRALKAHRLMRARAILERMRAGTSSIPEIVERVYHTTPRKLHGAAALSVFAHLEEMVERGIVTCDGPPSLGARYTVER